MKTILRTILVTALIALASSTHCRGEVFAWNIWGGGTLLFQAPSYGVITYNTPINLEMNWDDMALAVKLYDKTDINEGKIKMSLYRKANGYNMYNTAEGRLKVKGYDAYYLEGTMPDGSRALLCDMVSKKRNLVISITINYLFGNRETAEDIIKSFGEGVTKENSRKKQKIQSKEKSEEQKKELEREKEREKLKKQGALEEV